LRSWPYLMWEDVLLWWLGGGVMMVLAAMEQIYIVHCWSCFAQAGRICLRPGRLGRGIGNSAWAAGAGKGTKPSTCCARSEKRFALLRWSWLGRDELRKRPGLRGGGRAGWKKGGEGREGGEVGERQNKQRLARPFLCFRSVCSGCLPSSGSPTPKTLRGPAGVAHRLVVPGSPPYSRKLTVRQ
jgi:hypothetical protein